MGKLTIAWTNTALKQRNLTFDYWNEFNGNSDFSSKLLEHINFRTSQLIDFPLLGKKADFNNTRTISLGHYSIFYQQINNQIIITAFWDNRQNPEDLLSQLRK